MNIFYLQAPLQAWLSYTAGRNIVQMRILKDTLSAFHHRSKIAQHATTGRAYVLRSIESFSERHRNWMTNMHT